MKKLQGNWFGVVTCRDDGDVYEFATERQARVFADDHYLGSWTVSTRWAKAVVWKYTVTYYYEEDGRTHREESGLYASQTACRSAMRERKAQDFQLMEKRGYTVPYPVEHEMRAVEVQ